MIGPIEAEAIERGETDFWRHVARQMDAMEVAIDLDDLDRAKALGAEIRSAVNRSA